MKYTTHLFDLDGVLVNTNLIQYNTTKEAIFEILNYDISINKEIDDIFKSTITTVDKLQYLSKFIKINNEQINIIYENKKTRANIHFSNLMIDNDKIELFKYLKENNCNIAVVTNSNKISATMILNNIGIYNYIDIIVTNEDVINKKPNPEPYLKAIDLLRKNNNILISDCIIYEDSEVGIMSAKSSGCDYYHVKSVIDININTITPFLI